MNDEPAKAKDIADVRPTSLRHVIGQRKVIDTVSTTLDYCFQEQVPFPHCLMLGPPGMGKTQLSTIIAQELACGFHELLASAVKTPAEFYGVVMNAKDGDVVFIDEIDCLDKKLQTALLIALDERRIYVPNVSGGAPHSIKLANFSLIGATTEEYGILRPLADRFRLTLRYQFYGKPELMSIVQQRSAALGWPIHADVLLPIAARSKGTPRLALRLLQSCWRICRSQDHDQIEVAHLERACELESIDRKGLDYNEQRLLMALKEGPARLNVLATTLGLPSRTVSQVTESFLLRDGLLTKDNQGLRHLTQQGREYVADKCSTIA